MWTGCVELGAKVVIIVSWVVYNIWLCFAPHVLNLCFGITAFRHFNLHTTYGLNRRYIKQGWCRGLVSLLWFFYMECLFRACPNTCSVIDFNSEYSIVYVSS